MMSKHDYELIARVLRETSGNETYRQGAYALFNDLVFALAFELAQDNPRFDRDRFIEACNSYSPEEELHAPDSHPAATASESLADRRS